MALNFVWRLFELWWQLSKKRFEMIFTIFITKLYIFHSIYSFNIQIGKFYKPTYLHLMDILKEIYITNIYHNFMKDICKCTKDKTKISRQNVIMPMKSLDLIYFLNYYITAIKPINLCFEWSKFPPILLIAFPKIQYLNLKWNYFTSMIWNNKFSFANS
jgi:hypothetical protein